MCGINGFIDFHCKYSADQKAKVVHNMNEVIKYRGPNHEGMYSNEFMAMGMRRLSIIDLSTGNQPVFNEDNSIAVVFNGEIYNFQILRKRLVDLGHRFTTLSDTEVIVHGYEEYGKGIFTQMDGMFSISIYDSVLKKTILARDRMGEKPLYYYRDSDVFLYGSELKSLLSTGLIPRSINKIALNQYFQLTYIPSPLSIYENIYKVLPGTIIEISNSGMVDHSSYWSLEEDIYTLDSMSGERLQSQLLSLMKQSVKQRVISDVPIGVFLSGGIDSAIVTALMSDISEEPVRTFTIGFEEKEYDERSRAKLVSDLYKTNHHDYIFNYKEAFLILNHIFEQMDEPFADSSVLPTYFVSQCAAKDVKVVLTGDAGDELFLGYNKYQILYYKSIYKKVPAFLRKRMIEPLVKRIPDANSLTRKINKVISNTELEGFNLWKNLMSNAFKADELKQLFKDDFYQNDSMKQFEELYDTVDAESELQKVQFVDMKILLEGDMLTKVDRMSMLNSLEVRTPMLSKDMVSFAISLPLKYKLNKKELKKILKDTFRSHFPKGFDKLPKSGFGVPIDYWFRHELKSELENVLSKDVIDKQGIFNYNYIQLIIKEHFSKMKNRKSELWALFVFQKWYFRNIEG